MMRRMKDSNTRHADFFAEKIPVHMTSLGHHLTVDNPHPLTWRCEKKGATRPQRDFFMASYRFELLGGFFFGVGRM
jgi:hypothetical protein